MSLASPVTQDFEGSWEAGGTGVYEMKYVAKVAGLSEMHVWCDPQGKGERIALPGSPFQVGPATVRVRNGPSNEPVAGSSSASSTPAKLRIQAPRSPAEAPAAAAITSPNKALFDKTAASSSSGIKGRRSSLKGS